MKRIFLAPRANETAHEHFESTVINGREYSFIDPHLPDEKKAVLSSYAKIQIWGTKESLKNRWEQMQRGDFVLFYAAGNFYFSARVVEVLFSPELGSKLWPLDEDGKPWSCLFFITDLREIEIPIEVIRTLASYKSNWKAVMGFMQLNDIGTKAIISIYGSIEEFISQTLKGESEILDEEINEGYQLRDTDKLLRDASNFTTNASGYRIQTGSKKVRVDNQAQKRRVAEIEGFSCQICGWSLVYKNKAGKTAFRIDVDHIVEKSNGGDENVNNLWVLCPNCHAKKTHGVIQIDPKTRKITENGQPVELNHDNHLEW